MDEQAIFTAIPAGRLDEGRLKVTVFVTPRLSTGQGPGDLVPLEEFAAFRNWPQTLTESHWYLNVGGIGETRGIPLDDAITPDEQLWADVFGKAVVGAAGFQRFADATVHSYPVDEAVAAVQDLYRTIARESGTSFPAVTQGPLHRLGDHLTLPGGRQITELGSADFLRTQLARWRQESGDPRRLDITAVPEPQRPAVALAAGLGFYDRSNGRPPGDPAPVPEPTPPEFHSFVARCADYPELLRHLGLAIDLWIEDDPHIHEYTRVRIEGVEGSPDLTDLVNPDRARPTTATHRTERVWAPLTWEEADIVDGSLALTRPSRDERPLFLLDQIDPDGAVLNVATLLDSLRTTQEVLDDSSRTNDGAPSMTRDAASLPALRSTGLVIARRNRATDLVRHFDAAAQQEADRLANAVVELQAQDVTRGWRVDILDLDSPDPQWRSLHQRVGDYEFVEPGQPPRPLPVQPEPDEAYLKAASMTSTGADPSDDQYLHETLAGWDGWSLAVRRPGQVVDETGVADPVVDPAAPVDPGTEPGVADTGFPLAASFSAAPGSLPRLRFGRRYRVRVRAVDLAGNSVPDDQLDPEHEAELPTAYQRWEPVPSPAVVPLAEYTEGESLMRMVIRSTLNIPVAEYVSLERVQNLPGHVAGGPLGISYRTTNERHLVAPVTSVQFAETHGVLDVAFAGDPQSVAEQYALLAAREAASFLTHPGGVVVSRTSPAPDLTGGKDQLLPEGAYLVHPTQDLALPYLPDPLARGISFTTLPGDDASGPNATRLLRWPGEPDVWFDRRPVLLRIVDTVGGPPEPTFDEQTRVLTVPVPAGTTTTVRLSSFLDDVDIDLMRVWELMRDPATEAAQRAIVARGLHWMITPFSELTIVHAVEKPLEAPRIDVAPGPQRDVDATHSCLVGSVHSHAASTGRIDLDARWSEPVDDVLTPEPGRVTKSAHVTDFMITPTEVDALLVKGAGGGGAGVPPRHQARHEFGDTKHRWVDYTPTATTRFREYFPPEITGDPALITSVGEPVTVNVLSSARPAPPKVRYIVPTWTWTQTEIPVPDSPFAVRRVRSGGGLRIYLDRPWHSSGDDELLGVVLRKQPWLTWATDLGRGVAGSLEAQHAAEAWAALILEQAGEPTPADGTPVVDQLADLVAQGRVTLPETASSLPDQSAPTPLDVTIDVTLEASPGRAPRGTAAAVRFLADVDTAITQVRSQDVGAVVESSVATSRLIEAFLPLFPWRGPAPDRFLSTWGQDPVFESDPLPSGPWTHQFPLRTRVGHDLRLAEVPADVTVVGHTPAFDPTRRLWFCDVEVEAGTAYTPFIQLQLVRYQPHSVAGQHLSPSVKTDFVQLVPRREATFTVTPGADATVVTVRGPVGVPEHALTQGAVDDQLIRSRLVEAWVEVLPADAESDLDWARAGKVVRLDLRRQRIPHVWAFRSRYADREWVGAVPLPESGDGARVRVHVAEYELHRADPRPGAGPLQALLAVERRLVYSDEVEISAE